MAGPKGQLAKMWAILGQKGPDGIQLDPPVPSVSNTYLGATQQDVKIPKETTDAGAQRQFGRARRRSKPDLMRATKRGYALPRREMYQSVGPGGLLH